MLGSSCARLAPAGIVVRQRCRRFRRAFVRPPVRYRPAGGQVPGWRAAGGRALGGRALGRRAPGRRALGGRPLGGRPLGGRYRRGLPVRPGLPAHRGDDRRSASCTCSTGTRTNCWRSAGSTSAGTMSGTTAPRSTWRGRPSRSAASTRRSRDCSPLPPRSRSGPSDGRPARPAQRSPPHWGGRGGDRPAALRRPRGTRSGPPWRAVIHPHSCCTASDRGHGPPERPLARSEEVEVGVAVVPQEQDDPADDA